MVKMARRIKISCQYKQPTEGLSGLRRLSCGGDGWRLESRQAEVSTPANGPRW